MPVTNVPVIPVDEEVLALIERALLHGDADAAAQLEARFAAAQEKS